MKKTLFFAIVVLVLAGIALQPVDMSFAYSDAPPDDGTFAYYEDSYQQTEAPTIQTEPETMPTETVAEETIPPTEPEVTEQTVPPTEEPEDPNAPKGHNGVPLYFQTDYPDDVYGEGTVSSNGCSAACLAMIGTYLTGHEYLPDEMARYFGDSAENNIARLENGSEVMKLPYKKATNWYDTINALKAGKVVVALMNSRSLFTNSQHFIVLTGLNSEGKIMVNDSYEPNYDKWDIKNGLREGFGENDILLGYEGGWIYDKASMPEEPFIYYEPEPVRGEPRYDFELTETEKWFIAKVVWVESRGESRKGQQAVAEVILNRLASDRFPNTLQGVVYAADQFNSAKFLDKAKPYQMQYEAVENALLGPYVLPEDVFYFATTPKTSKIWGEIGGHVFCYAED